MYIFIEYTYIRIYKAPYICAVTFGNQLRVQRILVIILTICERNGDDISTDEIDDVDNFMRFLNYQITEVLRMSDDHELSSSLNYYSNNL